MGAAAHRQSRFDFFADEVIDQRSGCDRVLGSLNDGECVGNKEGAKFVLPLVGKNDTDRFPALDFNDRIIGIGESLIEFARRNRKCNLFVSGEYDSILSDLADPFVPRLIRSESFRVRG